MIYWKKQSMATRFNMQLGLLQGKILTEEEMFWRQRKETTNSIDESNSDRQKAR
jgi:hypothetical protein